MSRMPRFCAVTLRGRRIFVSREVDAPAAEVWTLISEFRHWSRWGPTVRDVTSQASEVGAGVTGQVLTPLGFRLPFVITDVEPGRSWDWKVAGKQATGHTVTQLEGGRSMATFSVYWLLAPYAAVLCWGLRRLAAAAETEAAAGPD